MYEVEDRLLHDMMRVRNLRWKSLFLGRQDCYSQLRGCVCYLAVVPANFFSYLVLDN